MASPPQDLVSAIKGYSKDTRVQEALLFGAFGESTWVNAPGPPPNRWGGYFGFTPPNYSSTLWTAPATEQVAAIGPSYLDAIAGTGTPGWRESQAGFTPGVPPNIGGAALAEYLTIAAEGPEYDYAEMQSIVGSNQPASQYGANTGVTPSVAVSAYNQIQQSLGTGSAAPATGDSPPPGQLPGGKIGPPAAGFPGSPQLPYGPPAPGFPGSPGYTGITTANPPATYPGMSSQMAATLDQQMNPVVHASGTDTQGATKPAAGIISDVEGFLTGGIIGSDQYAPLHMILGVNLKGAAENVVDAPINNAWNAVKAGLVRFGIGVAGLMLMAAGLFIIVMGVSGGGGGGMPMPVPVPV
jgi:hypothetical protein